LRSAPAQRATSSFSSAKVSVLMLPETGLSWIRAGWWARSARWRSTAL
jgi:hypothetical protein